jgi:large subunit ribosomal protein L6
MSRIGKQSIIIPDKVQVSLADSIVKVTGPKGELTLELHPNVNVEIADKEIKVSIKSAASRKEVALWGLFRNLINNMVIGVTEGYVKKLEINGVGFRATVAGSKITLNVGFSHPVEYNLPAGISAVVEKNVLTISGIDKTLVGEVAANIRKIKKPEPYKGKGIKYLDEVIKRKEGKTATKSA